MFGSGVLNEAIRPATPTGPPHVETARCAMLAGIVRPYERRPSPATKKPISIAASVSPSASAGGFPVSSATTADSSSRRSRSASAISRTMSPRSTGVGSAHACCARRAAADRRVHVARRPERAARQSSVAVRRPGACRTSRPKGTERPRPPTMFGIVRTSVGRLARAGRAHTGPGRQLPMRSPVPCRPCAEVVELALDPVRRRARRASPHLAVYARQSSPRLSCWRLRSSASVPR